MAIEYNEIYPGMSMAELKLIVKALRELGGNTVEPNELNDLADRLETTPI